MAAFWVCIFIFGLSFYISKGIDQIARDSKKTKSWRDWSSETNRLTYYDYKKGKWKDPITGQEVIEHTGKDCDGNYFIYTTDKSGQIVRARYLDVKMKGKPVNLNNRQY